MKTRIISGIVMGVIVAIVLALGYTWNPFIIALAIGLISAGAIYELLHNVAGIKSKTAIVGACLYSLLIIIVSDTVLAQSLVYAFLLTVGYSIFAVIIILKNHNKFDLGKIASLFGLPLIFSIEFLCLLGVINRDNGLYYLLLLLNFSSVCDMGAYFTGVTIGKHKLCPVISPKKTVEGAIGGILSSVIVTFVLTFCFNQKILIPMALTIPLCILGMIGDLFASAIKRSVGLKDYSNLIPGHGGILDRVDSIIMIVPLMYTLINLGVL